MYLEERKSAIEVFLPYLGDMIESAEAAGDDENAMILYNAFMLIERQLESPRNSSKSDA